MMLCHTGGDGVVYTWDIRSKRCMGRHVDEGTLSGASLACSTDYFAAGSDGGVVNLHSRAAVHGVSCGLALFNWSRIIVLPGKLSALRFDTNNYTKAESSPRHCNKINLFDSQRKCIPLMVMVCPTRARCAPHGQKAMPL